MAQDPKEPTTPLTDTVLKKSLSAPNPEHLTGYINNKGTNFVLFAGQIVTLSESIEIHVEVPDRANAEPNKTCSHVKLYNLPEWKLKFDKQSCPGDDKPIKLDPPAAKKA
ncbi:hypothetical protein PaG_03157 [Moesziomyces aphidis]|uniref:Uncharacterized protein n=1 Tax=Moesziomyces aphidis TaxID=84754 RepID=W3VLX7_MOEAP|nr:hypothetical protein PaG_03157 [Moesziomyces aphidis]